MINREELGIKGKIITFLHIKYNRSRSLDNRH
jgi:hypothetical protein